MSALQSMVWAHQSVLVLSGAGASADSGISTFRGPGAGLAGFAAVPVMFPYAWRWMPSLVWPVFDRFWRQPMAAAAPNAFHRAVAAWYREGKHVAVVTTNVDGLHQRAGLPASLVHEIHGSIWGTRCSQCHSQIARDDPVAGNLTEPGYCPECGGAPRPDIVLVTEALPLEAAAKAHDAVAQRAASRHTVLLLVVGVSVDPTMHGYVKSLVDNHLVTMVLVDPNPAHSLAPEARLHILERAGPLFERALDQRA